MSVTVDEAKLGEFMGQMAGYMTGGALCFSIWLGDAGLYRTLVAPGPVPADQLAARPAVIPDWSRMAGRPSRGRPDEYDPTSDSYELSREAVSLSPTRARRSSPPGR